MRDFPASSGPGRRTKGSGFVQAQSWRVRGGLDAIQEATVERRGFARAMRRLGHTVLVMLGGFAAAAAQRVLGRSQRLSRKQGLTAPGNAFWCQSAQLPRFDALMP
jgi:hypothetical protein